MACRFERVCTRNVMQNGSALRENVTTTERGGEPNEDGQAGLAMTELNGEQSSTSGSKVHDDLHFAIDKIRQQHSTCSIDVSTIFILVLQ